MFKQDVTTPVPEVDQGPKRFYLVTSNIDSEVERVGFKAAEIYETRGNVCSWQCAIPCSKYIWKVDDDFRFEVSQENGKAPTIKFVDKVRLEIILFTLVGEKEAKNTNYSIT